MILLCQVRSEFCDFFLISLKVKAWWWGETSLEIVRSLIISRTYIPSCYVPWSLSGPLATPWGLQIHSQSGLCICCFLCLQHFSPRWLAPLLPLGFYSNVKSMRFYLSSLAKTSIPLHQPPAVSNPLFCSLLEHWKIFINIYLTREFKEREKQ